MEHATPLPSGRVTFLLTDIEGSMRLWEQHPDAMRHALARHHALITAVVRQCAGIVVKSQGEGDRLFAVFARATDAVGGASALQRALFAEPWPAETALRVRVALHTGEADLREQTTLESCAYMSAAVPICRWLDRQAVCRALANTGNWNLPRGRRQPHSRIASNRIAVPLGKTA